MLQVKKISKKYVTGDLVQIALNQVSLNLRDNEFVAILGPSGSGKTTLLNIVGGLDRYESGDLIINGISTKKYKDRDWDSYRNHTIGFVFQSYNLIPHQTLLSNVELALTISGISKAERRQKAMHALDQVGLGNQYHKKPNQLSGGQMQRVAIARALVNDPDILLADEPTGALDSSTSVQVMELLKEVAKDRLVVMVTHNPELAKEYATRIVNLKDGHILSDSNPYHLNETQDPLPQHKTMGKTSMSLITSLSLSFNNLKTKKGRTILTSFAGSIGIIGIALILSLSNGVNTYIKNVEEETLSEYPLQIQSTGFDMTSMLMGEQMDINKDEKEEVHVIDMLTNMFSKIGSNDLKSLKKYLDDENTKINEYVNSIEYSYNVKPQIFLNKEDHYRQVHPDKSFQALGVSSSNSTNSMMSMAMSTDVFMPMPAHTSLFSDQYDIKAGKWPENNNECVLILTTNGSISDFLLYTLGLRDGEELDEMVQQFSREENVQVPDMKKGYRYEDIIGITFKTIHAADFYQYDADYNVWRDKSKDAAYMKEKIKEGQDLKIVGIVQPKDGNQAAMLRSGIYYPSTLTTQMIEEAANSQIVKDQLENKEVNVFSGKSFDNDKQESTFDMKKLFSIDQNKMQEAFLFDSNQVNFDLSNLNNKLEEVNITPIDLEAVLSQIKFELTSQQMETLVNDLAYGYQDYINKHPEYDVSNATKELFEYLKSQEVSNYVKEEIEKAIEENGEIRITIEQLEAILKNVIDNYLKEHQLPDYSKINESLKTYLNSDEAKLIIKKNINEIMSASNLQEQLSGIIKEAMGSRISSLTQTIENEMNASILNFSESLSNAFKFNKQAFSDAIHVNMGEEELSELMLSLMNKEMVTYDNNLKKLGYAELEKPWMIHLYPKDFESKGQVLNILNDYNTHMEQSGQEEKVITYTDVVGTLMSSVTNIINVISYVLVAFVAISLIVSSIMIGVITYISVLERKKEIGILRAIGASKRNISQVFNAETFIIGLLSGVIGIGVTLLLLIPGNQIIHAVSGSNEINAILPLGAGIILIILSVILTLIGGIIPSKKAAKEDPVAALRSE